MQWLIEEDVGRRLHEAHGAMQITAQEHRDFELGYRSGDDGPECLVIAGDTAEIRVEGVLTCRPDIWAWLLGLGNTTYADLREAIAEARKNGAVKDVRIVVDSCGGQADELFETMDDFAQLRAEKPTKVYARHAHSAAYGIAAVAGPIEAVHRSSMFGSVGVATSAHFYQFVEVLDLTNSESPDKRPDPRTDEGLAVITRELDAIFDLFAESIAAGRSTDRDGVAANYGRGASFVAAEAKRRGMIDSIAGEKPAKSAPSEPESSAIRIPPSAGTGAPTEYQMSNENAPTADETRDEQDAPEATEEERPTTASDAQEDEEERDEDEPEEGAGDDSESDDEQDSDSPDEKPEEEEEDEMKDKPSAVRQPLAEARTADARTQRARNLLGRPDASVDDALGELELLQTQNWLDAECDKRGLALREDKRDQYVAVALESGRNTVGVFLDDLSKPPTGDPMARAAAHNAGPATLDDAIEQHLDAAREKLGDKAPEHHVRAYARKLAAKANPALVEDPAAA